MKLKQLFAITAIASALVLTGCKEDKKPEAAAAPLKIKVGVMSGLSTKLQKLQQKSLKKNMV